MNITAIIPARMGASRLPGKPLADIGGLPMVVHTWRAAHEHPDISEAFVATDHADIAQAIEAEGGQAIITGEHPSGTDRCHAAWSTLGQKEGPVLNLQGDEPFPDPAHIAAVCHRLQHQETQVVTARRPAEPGESEMPERVKVECDATGKALRFSRSPAPIKGGHHIHLGLYGFAPRWLSRCASLPVGRLEQKENLEQLRWLEAGIHIQVVDVKGADGPGSVDTAEDLVRVQKWYQAR
ncbi:MAG: 3-deoxy-manno-octulosonate cytidylyltransferase [Crocinitomicaceae bacterium]|nr:3-deoxy-manno-octulosonate cytidylyltransferase [Crocinitomicaceae bacterium]